MAFCTNCGRKLNPGEICICQQQKGMPTGQMPHNPAGAPNQQVPNGQALHNPAGVAGGQVPNGQALHNPAGAAGGQVPHNPTGVPGGQVLHNPTGTQGAPYQGGTTNRQMGYNPVTPNQQMYYQQPKPQMNFDIQANAKNYLQILLKPKSVGTAFVKEANILIAFIFIAIQAICSGLYAMVFFGKINSLIKSQLIAKGADSDDLVQFNLYKFPIIKDFFIAFIASAALSCIVALVVWGMVSAFKGKTNFAEVISATAVRCIGKTPVILVAVLLGIVSVSWGIIFFLLSALVGVCYSGMVVPTGVGADGDKTVFIVLVASIVSMICIVIFYRYISINFTASALQTQITKALVELRNIQGNLSELLSGMF